jgi:hypothetical protein
MLLPVWLLWSLLAVIVAAVLFPLRSKHVPGFVSGKAVNHYPFFGNIAQVMKHFHRFHGETGKQVWHCSLLFLTQAEICSNLSF